MRRLTSRWASPALAITGCILLPMGLVFLTVGIAVSAGVNDPQLSGIFLPVFGLTGLVLAVSGGTCLVLERRKKRVQRELLARGQVVMTQFLQARANPSVQINGRWGYEVYCGYGDGMGTQHIFKSGLVWVDPTPFLQDVQIPVYVDGDNFERYYVALDEALSQVKMHG